MPLRTGSSREDISANIRQLMKDGYPQEQAIAIAMRKAGKSNKDKAMDGAALSEWLEDLEYFERKFGGAKGT